MADDGARDSIPPRPVRVHLLGPFAIDAIDIGALGSRKARLLVKRLALARGRPVAADTLVEVLWGGDPPARPSDQLSVLASRARSVLGAERIERIEAGYRLVHDWLDLEEVDALADQAQAALASGMMASARAAAGAALRLLDHPLLEDDPNAWWADEERAALERLAADLAALAAEAELAGGDPVAAAGLAERALLRDPYDERVLRVLMRAHADAGRPASALASYAAARDLLRDELGASPSAETEAVHTTILLTGDAARPPAPKSPDPEPDAPRLVGRSRELGRLDAALAAARSSGPRTLVVVGEAGIGKSSLVAHWTARPDSAGWAVLVGRTDDGGGALPLQPVLDALAEHVARLEPAAAGALLGAEATVLDPLLGRSPRTPRDRRRGDQSDPRTDHGTEVVDADSARLVLFTALASVLERIADDGSTVLVLEDVHTAGSTTSDWVRFARRRIRQRPLLIVATARPDRPGTAEGLAADETIDLGPLSPGDVAELVAPHRAEELAERSGGHPLFLVELAAADPGELPSSIRDSVATRLRNRADLALVLEAAAVLGGPVDLDLLAAVVDLPPGSVLARLEAAVQARLMDEAGTSFVFHHALVQEAVEAGVSASRRAFLHRQAAHLLELRSDAEPFTVAEHARLGGDRELASRCLADAASRAAAAFDHHEAERLLDEAIALHDSVEVRRRRAIVRLSLGRFDEAASDAEEALARDPRPSVLEVAAWAAYYQRNFDRALLRAEWLAGDPDAGPAAVAGNTVMGRVLHAHGDLARADGRLTAAVADADADQLAVATVWLASLRNHQGRAAEALDLQRHVLRPGARITQPFAPAHGLMNQAYALAVLGHPEEALRALEQADRRVEELGQTDRYRPAVLNYRAWILRYLGSSDEADEGNAEARDQFTFVEAQAQAMVDLVDGRLHRGDLDGAAHLLAEAAPLQIDDHSMRWRHALRARLLEARLALLAGDHAAARERAAAVGDEARALGLPRYCSLAALTDAWAVAAAGERVDLAAVATELAALDHLAGVEGWWWAAQLARVTASDDLRRLAVTKVAALAGRAGDRAVPLTSAADRILGR